MESSLAGRHVRRAAAARGVARIDTRRKTVGEGRPSACRQSFQLSASPDRDGLPVCLPGPCRRGRGQPVHCNARKGVHVSLPQRHPSFAGAREPGRRRHGAFPNACGISWEVSVAAASRGNALSGKGALPLPLRQMERPAGAGNVPASTMECTGQDGPVSGRSRPESRGATNMPGGCHVRGA